MKIVGTPPDWAMTILRAEARRHHRKLPDVTWQITRKLHATAGSYSLPEHPLDDDKIWIRQGRSRLRAKLAWLHEIAHWLSGEGHSHTFWLKAWELYRRYRLPIGYVLRDESHYRQGALWAYQASRDRRGRWPATHVIIKTSISTLPKES